MNSSTFDRYNDEIKKRKKRDLTLSYDKDPYTSRKFIQIKGKR